MPTAGVATAHLCVGVVGASSHVRPLPVHHPAQRSVLACALQKPRVGGEEEGVALTGLRREERARWVR